MWTLSTGAKNAILGKAGTAIQAVAASTISCGDGDGSGGRDTINDSGSGLAGFTVGDSITILGGTNTGVTTRILSVAAGVIEVAAGTLTAEAAGSTILLVSSEGGAFVEVFKNCTAHLYNAAPPSDADSVEAGTKLCEITLDGNAFVSGSPTNGLNFGQVADGTVGRAIDPATGVEEVWKGTPSITGSALSVWVYANDVVTGASTTAVRMVGRVSTSGAEFNMTGGTTVTSGVEVVVDSVLMNI